MMQFIAILAQTTEPAAPPAWSFGFSSIINEWLLATILIVSVGLMVYLYRAQQRIATRRVVIPLTAIRALLLILLGVVLLQPRLVFQHVSHTAGTLWLILDQSPSMANNDPQSTAVEKLRWADATGMLPGEGRPRKIDRTAAELYCEREELAATQHRASSAADFIKQLRQWNDRVDAVKTEVAKYDLPATANKLERSEKLVSGGLATADSRDKVAEAAGDIPFSAILTNLDSAISDLQAAADKSDADFLAKHATDTAVQDALARAGKVSRSEQAFAALTEAYAPAKAAGEDSLSEVMGKYNIKIASFADTPQLLNAVDPADLPLTVKAALSPVGQSTNLYAAMQSVTEQIAGDEAAQVLLLSDGRANTPGDPTESSRLLAARGVRVFSLGLGSVEVSPDAAVEQVDAPDWIYKDDTLKATAMVRLDGLPNRPLKVELHRRGGSGAATTDTLLDTQTVQAATNQETKRVTFTDKPADTAVYEYEVRVQAAAGEVNKENNSQRFRVAVKKDKLAVLVVEEQPRWEYRYLVNNLDRDQRVKLQTVLLQPIKIEDVLSPDPVMASPKNERREAQILPKTPADWAAFDMIVLGDVPPELLTPDAQQGIAAAVRDKGATLIVLAGQHHMPARYAGSPLADLLPVTTESAWQQDQVAAHMTGGFRPAIAPEGAGSVLSDLGPDGEASARIWAQMPLWFWHADQTIARPAATVEWSISEPDANGNGDQSAAGTLADARRHALLASQSLGLGRVLYLASDQTWRLRQVDRENAQDRFWGQVIRWAVGNDLPAGGKFVRFGTTKPHYGAGEAAVVNVKLLKEDYTPLTGATFEVVARTAPSEQNPEPKEVGRAVATESAQAPGYYRANLAGLPAGTFQFSVEGGEPERLLITDPSATTRTVTADVAAQLNLEQRNMNTDFPALARLSNAGGGVMLTGPYADILARHIPHIVRTLNPTPTEVGFFTDPKNPYTRYTHLAFMALFTLLLTVEWVLRKAAGLV